NSFWMVTLKAHILPHHDLQPPGCRGSAPVLSMKEISLDPSLRQSGSVVEVEQPLRGKYLTVGCPMKFSAFTPDIKAAPLLGEHTAAVLQELGYSDDEIAAMKQNHAI
uniref:CoA transferase n=1 Tax=Escherichia coli TaxID=562 RepID=UPI001FCE995D